MSKIIITLRSDLCAASGDGFSSVIDTDISYDKYGFPLIGGRRLKGCLRDAALLIGTDPETIDGIFGKTGSSESGSLRISDAVLSGYDKLKSDAIASGLNAEQVIDLFTYTRAATAIMDDTAKDNSLRFTRVVKHYSPIDEKETVFSADAEIDEKYSAVFADICRALRNIGYKRSRGYGAVKCEFIYEKTEKACPAENITGNNLRIDYTVLLKSNVMIPSLASDETADYIPGTSVMGFFANEYLKNGSPDEKFEDMFLKNNVRFSNLYLSDENGTEYFPAPSVLGKIKGEKGVCNIAVRSDDGRIVKPVKSGYCTFSMDIKTPLTETVYHHSKSGSTLYTQTSLCPDQYFQGSISGKAEYIKELYTILNKTTLRFGRSKTAQYSNCELVKATVSEDKDTMLSVKKGSAFIALLLSDVLIPDEMGGYDFSAEGLKNALGIAADCDKRCSSLRYRTIGGYNSKWNMKKPMIRTIAAGSALLFTADSDMTLPERMTIGSKQNEGFGAVMFCAAYRFSHSEASEMPKSVPSKSSGQLAKLIADNRIIEEMRISATEHVNEISSITVTASQLGRYTMMVKNAADLMELKSMARNIRSEKSKNFFLKTIIEGKDSKAEHYSETTVHGREMWREYLILVLTLLKYEKRGDSNENE